MKLGARTCHKRYCPQVICNYKKKKRKLIKITKNKKKYKRVRGDAIFDTFKTSGIIYYD